MTWVAAAVVGGSLIGGAISARGQQNAAQTQADATANAQNQLLAAGQQGAQQYAPYQALGQTGINQLNAQLPYLTRQFTNADLNANLAPNFQFMLNQGQGATIENANVGGGGSNVNLANQLFTQNYAQNAYQNAFNNYQAQQTNIYNRLAGISGIGLQGATGSANAMIGTGTNVAGLTSGLGNAQAASQIGQANAYAGGVNNISNLAALYGLQGNNAATPIGGGGGGTYNLGGGYQPTGSNFLTS
jgi:hypothetical protein